MDRKEHTRDRKYIDPFQSPRANPKHAFHQVNGETEQNLHNYINQIQAKKHHV